MFKQEYREYFSSEINPYITAVEKFKHSKEYIELVGLFSVIYRVVCYPDFFFKKYIILNTKLGILAELLNELKKEVLLISPYYEELYFTPDKFKDSFKLLNWKNDSAIRLFYYGEILIDFNFQLDELNNVSYFISFLNNNNNPKLILLDNSNIDLEKIILEFEKNNYKFNKTNKEKILNILKNKITKYNITRLLLFDYIPPKIIKEDIGICLEQ